MLQLVASQGVAQAAVRVQEKVEEETTALIEVTGKVEGYLPSWQPYEDAAKATVDAQEELRDAIRTELQRDA
jgi:hypothetical protein